MKSPLFIGYIFFWILFSIFDFNVGNVIVNYSLIKRTPTFIPDNDPDLLPGGFTKYRIEGQSVITKTFYPIGTFLGYYRMERNYYNDFFSNCIVMDLENWTCTEDNEKGKFGFNDGNYFSYKKDADNRTVFDKDKIYVSRFAYVINKCKWVFADNIFVLPFLCGIMPFIV